MRLRQLYEDGRIVKGVNTTPDVDVNSISKEAAKFGFKVDKDGRPQNHPSKVKGSSTNVAFNLGLTEGNLFKNPKNTFLAKADTAYDFLKLGQNLANLKSMPTGSNVDEPDIMIAPYAGSKEMKYLMKQLKRIGYDVQDAQGYKDAHYDEKPTGGEAPPQLKKLGPLGKIKLDKLKSVQSERQWHKLGRQIVNVLNDDYAPIQIDRKGRIVNGHHRYDALRLAGAEYARVHMVDEVLENMLDEGWSKKYKDSINCSNPKGFSQKAHCAGRKKKESVDEGLQDAVKAAQLLKKALQSGREQDIFAAIKFGWGYIKNPTLRKLIVGVVKKLAQSQGMNWDEAVAYIKQNTGIDVTNVNENMLESRKFDRAPDAVMYKSPHMKGMGTMITIGYEGSLGRQLVPFWKTENGYETDEERYGDYNDMFKQYYEKGDYEINENFADGKKKGKSRPGRVKRAGASCKGSVTSLRKKAAKYGGEKGKMYHWCANMKGGKK